MKRGLYYYLLSLLKCKLESAELDEALKSDHLFTVACNSIETFDEEYVMAKIEHKLALKKVKLLKKQIREVEKAHKYSL